MTTEEKKGLETALRDAYLYGNEAVSIALDAIVEWAGGDRGQAGLWDPLIKALRGQLRELYEIAGKDDRDSNPWIRTGWRSEAYAQTLVTKSDNLTPEDQLVSLNDAAGYLQLEPSVLVDLAIAGQLPAPLGLRGTLYWPTRDIFYAKRFLDLRYMNVEGDSSDDASGRRSEPSSD